MPEGAVGVPDTLLTAPSAPEDLDRLTAPASCVPITYPVDSATGGAITRLLLAVASHQSARLSPKGLDLGERAGR